MTTPDMPLRRIAGARQILKQREEAYLRSKAWTATSQTPGSFWMWERRIDGRLYLADHETAVRIQDHLDAEAYFAAHPEEFND